MKSLAILFIPFILLGDYSQISVEADLFHGNNSSSQLSCQADLLVGNTDPIDKYRNKATLQQDIDDGNQIYIWTIYPTVNQVKDEYQMVRKVFLDNPSADPAELSVQVKGILKDMVGIGSPQDLAEFVGKIGLDAFVDLFTSLGAREVNMARQVKYDVIIEAVTSICFPDYTPTIEQYEFEDKLLYFSTKVKLQHLTNHKRYKLRARFIAGKLFGIGGLASFTSDWRFENKMQDPTAFQFGLKGMFQKSEYRFRD